MIFQGGQFELNILLPKDKDGLIELEDKIELKDIEDLWENRTMKQVDVSLPKFRVERNSFQMLDMFKEVQNIVYFTSEKDFFMFIFLVWNKRTLPNG